MEEQRCIVCGRAFPAGLHVLGCLICFPCERRLLLPLSPPRVRRRLRRLYQGEPLLHGRQEI
ncbi:MAG: hypothetical protein GX637_01335 [Clostridiales bacterium]|nr:hypothetical protein [Clostridiales bacterium]